MFLLGLVEVDASTCAVKKKKELVKVTPATINQTYDYYV
jgi:ferritin-like protein